MEGSTSLLGQKQNQQTSVCRNTSGGCQKDLWLVTREGSLHELDSALALLKKNGGNIDSRNIFGLTPLHIATWRNHIPIVRRLLAAGADPDARDGESGWTSLHRALHFGHLAVASILLQSGASLALEDSKNRTPVDLLCGPVLQFLRRSSVGEVVQTINSVLGMHTYRSYHAKLMRFKVLILGWILLQSSIAWLLVLVGKCTLGDLEGEVALDTQNLISIVRDVSFEVHKVMELLVGWVNAKILGGRDRYWFLRLLSQVAFLEDMVNSWAYTLRSLERDSQVPLSNPGTMIGFLDNYDASKCSPVGSNASKPNISQKGSHEVNVPEHSSQRLETDNSEFVDSDKGVTHLGLANSEMRLTISEDPFQQMASLVHSSPGLHFQSSSSTVDPLASENTLNAWNKTNHIAMCREGFGSSKQSNGLEVKESVLPSSDGVYIYDGTVGVMNLSARKVSYQCNGLSTAEMGLPSEGTLLQN